MLNRRAVLGMGVGVGAGVLVGVGGCVGVPVRRFEAAQAGASRQEIEVSVTDFLQAAAERNAMQLQVEGWPTIALLIRNPITDTYLALSARCTHLGCTVRAGDGELRCPCHGAVYGLDGSVLGGPAPSALARLGCVREGDRVRVSIAHI